MTNSKIYLQQIVKSVNNQDGINSVSDQTKEQQGQQNHWLLSNLLLQGRSESANSMDAAVTNSPVRMRESNNNSPYMSNQANEVKGSPQQKPVNLLPAVPIQTSRKLSEREQRDCDIIGKNNTVLRVVQQILIFIFIWNTFVGRLQKDS